MEIKEIVLNPEVVATIFLIIIFIVVVLALIFNWS